MSVTTGSGSVTIKKQFQPVVSFLERRSPIWQQRMGLAHFHIEHVFLDSFEGTPRAADDFEVTACCEVRWNYLQAKIKWYLPSAVRHSEQQLEATLVHELCHVLLGAEQGLLDVELDRLAKQASGDEADALCDQFYERLELSTEMAARAILAGWVES